MTEVAHPDLAFCPRCAARLELRRLETDGRERLVCPACAYVFYQNPRVVAGLLPERDGHVLLIRRGVEPSYGLWTFPGGYLELGESTEEGARREALEEVGLEIEPGDLVGVYTRVAQGIVVVVYRGVILSPETKDPVPGPEVLETAWVHPDRIPWPDLAFESTEAALRDWVRLVAGPMPPGPPGRPAR